MLVIVVWWLWQHRRPPGRTDNEWVRVVEEPFRFELADRGELQALHRAILSAPDLPDSALRLVELARDSAGVAAGEVVARFDDRVWRAMVAALEDDLKALERQVQGAMPDSAAESAPRPPTQELLAKRRTLQKLQQQLQLFQLRSPGDGMVTRASGMNAPPVAGATFVKRRQELLSVIDLSRLSIPLPSDSRLPKSIDLPVRIAVEAIPEHTFAGRLVARESVRKTAGSAPDTSAAAMVEVDARGSPLRLGMRVSSVMAIDSLARSLSVPDSAVFEIDGQPVIFPRATWPAPRQVKVGCKWQGTMVVVEGATAGEEVALHPPARGIIARPLDEGGYRNAQVSARDALRRQFLALLERERSLRLVERGFDSGTAGHLSADSTLSIEGMLTRSDSSGDREIQQLRIGPGEGGKLAPLHPDSAKPLPSSPRTSSPRLDSAKLEADPPAPVKTRVDSSGTGATPPELP